MAKTAKKKKTAKQRKINKRSSSIGKAFSPFKDVKELRQEITEFLNVHKVRIQSHAKRISDYFEMCCFNYVVKFYQNNGFEVSVKNLQNGKYRYKCSTQGNQSNFSHFEISLAKENEIFVFEIHHNLAVQSSYTTGIYTTPDISVVRSASIKTDSDFYEGNKNLSYVLNTDMISFFEVKQFNPFPELLFNFIGTLNELKRDIMNNTHSKAEPCHLAPSLMVSGKPNMHADKIKLSLQNRYCINIIFDLFSSGLNQFSPKKIEGLRKIEQSVIPI